jgi:creatinine amidohydrolase
MTHRRLHRLADITLEKLRQLDRTRTAVLLPVGMVEIHGPHLPLGTDTYAVDALTLAAAAWLLEHDQGLHVLILPTIPYGTDPVDKRRPNLFATSGSVAISRETLKALVSDVAGHIVRFGFRYVFPVGFHGGPDQSLVLNEVCDEMRGRHPGLIMFEPTGYVMAGAELDVTPGLATLLGRPLTPQEEVVLKGSVHASMFETSMMLHLQPGLVDPVYRTLRSIEWSQLYTMESWPAYLGAAPAHANPEIGAAVLRWRGVRAAALIRRAMNGEDLTHLPRHPTWVTDQAEDDSRTDLKHLPASPAANTPAEDPASTPPASIHQTKAGRRRKSEDDPDDTRKITPQA